jgi:class 3 adenylate cyclase
MGVKVCCERLLPGQRFDVEAAPQLSSIDVIASALEPVMPAVGRMSSPDGAVTLMLGDLVDAPAGAQRLGQDRWDQFLRDHHLLVERVVSSHDGQVAKFQADGFVASFNSAQGGLHAALELQRTFAGTSLDGQTLSMRLGLNSGFVIANPDELLGRNVVLAARIAAKARAGEILVSSTLKQYTESDPSLSFEPRGEYHFKGLHGEHDVYAVAWG